MTKLSDQQLSRTAALPNGRHDPMEYRRAKRSGRERGAWIYISAEQLMATGFDPADPPPLYRTWSSARGRGGLHVRLYRQEEA